MEEKQEQEKEQEKEQEQEALTTETLIKELKDAYEEKILKQRLNYEKQLNEQKDVIKQLLLGDGDANTPKPTIIDKINARRSAQNKKW